VFDLDGVLVASEEVWDEVRERYVRGRGGRYDDEVQRAMMGMSSSEWSRYLHDEAGVPDEPDAINREVVRLMLEAFPHERFGTVTGEVKSISNTVLAPSELSIPGLKIDEPVFRVRVALSRIHGWLRPGGSFFLRDVVFSFGPGDCARGVEDWIGRVAQPAGQGFTREDFATHVREEHSSFRWILEGLIERAGFRILAVDCADEAYADFRCVRP